MFYNRRYQFFKVPLAFIMKQPIKNRLYTKHTPEIKRLIHGYEQFRTNYFNNSHYLYIYQGLVKEGQQPKTMVVACSDSRVDPSIILNSAPGQLFVVRNVANLVPPCDDDRKHHGTSAALEFAVQGLKVQNIIVLGHSHCGGILSLLKDGKTAAGHSNFISSWMSIAKEAKEKALTQACDQPLEKQAQVCEEHSLSISYKNLLTFPWIKEKVDAGLLHLHAWRFDLTEGILQCFNPNTKQFEDLVDEKNTREASRKLV